MFIKSKVLVYVGGKETMAQHNIKLDDKTEEILDNQKRSFNLSKFVREALLALE